MEEELAKALAWKAESNPQSKPAAAPITPPIQMTKMFGVGGMMDAKRMSFDENMPSSQYQQYGTSPLSSILGQSPGAGYNPARRDSLKNMWHLQDFGTE